MTRVLITNDDGIDAPGLCALAEAALGAGFDVTVAAPAVQSSGSSASIMAAETNGRIGVEHRTLAPIPEVKAFAVQGGPGLIALIAARGAFGDPADVVLSGVNHGANVGRAILHSGTVGAALTGGLNGARAMAVSLDVGMNPGRFHWKSGADAAIALIPELLAREEGTVMNVNVPNSESARGIRESTLAPFGIVQMTVAESEESYLRLAVEELPTVPTAHSDAANLADGWITVTGIDSIIERPLGLGAQPGSSDEAGSPPGSGGSGTR